MTIWHFIRRGLHEDMRGADLPLIFQSRGVVVLASLISWKSVVRIHSLKPHGNEISFPICDIGVNGQHIGLPHREYQFESGMSLQSIFGYLRKFS